MLYRNVICVLGVMIASTLGCGSSELSLAGRTLVDGAPMDSGTIRFDSLDAPVDGKGSKGVGAKVEDGVFRLPAGHGLTPGKYRVSATAFRRTGKEIVDYQRGTVQEMIQLTLSDSPKEIQLENDTSKDLTIEFSTDTKQ